MKNCPNCAGDVPAETIICPNCGFNLIGNEAGNILSSPHFHVSTEVVSKTISNCSGFNKIDETREYKGRQFSFPDRCSQCGKSPATDCCMVSSTLLTWNARFEFQVAVPLCASCAKKKPKPALIGKYSSDCGALVFSNHAFQTDFENQNPRMIQSYGNFLEVLKKA